MIRKDVLDKFKSTLDKTTKQLYDKTLDHKDIQEMLSVSYDIYKIIKEKDAKDTTDSLPTNCC